jgi:hypothetical protein
MGEGVVEGISTKYHGSLKGTRLEAALMGSMADKLSPGFALLDQLPQPARTERNLA